MEVMALVAAVALALTLLLVAIILRIWSVVVPHRVKSSLAAYKVSPPMVTSADKTRENATVRTMVVLGSGGHTTEILKLMKRLNRSVYTPIAFVVAETDKTSQEKTALDWKPSAADEFVIIPRSREVGSASFFNVVVRCGYGRNY
jgi:beta-1,4-N-acetylglucosaminyltransferase